ncbi:GNAT family N-acetyltransferase [Kibdelosporangium lantanae]|uniref:GNAT family N-acetyltransferase n=1 Tax=Kibdelosporangium lantanae TaxID=1497396 RepID=A0ABW3MAT2_9PSEU
MTEIEIRPARPEDIPGLVESSAALFTEDAGQRDPTMNTNWPHEHGTERFTETTTDPNHLVLVAIADNQVIGHLTAVLESPTTKRPVRIATLASLYVRPAVRGAGTAANLVETFRTWARENQADLLAVTAYATNDQAIRFYQKHGFTPATLTLETTP